jgi:Gnt-I system low-affinity gluconate transporter
VIDFGLILCVLAGIGILLFLILRLKIQAFLALLISSIAVALLAGVSPADTIDLIKKGMGDTLGFVAVVVGLGAMFGAILEHSGGVESLTTWMLGVFGEKKSNWAMVVVGFLVSIPVFFDVAFILLVPLVYALQRRTGLSLLHYAIPLLAGLAITHAFIPPTPGPVAVADIIHADLGLVILFGLIVGIPTAIISGPVFGKFIARKIHVVAPESHDTINVDHTNYPSPVSIISIIAIPIVLILFHTFLDSPFGKNLPIDDEVIKTFFNSKKKLRYL